MFSEESRPELSQKGFFMCGSNSESWLGATNGSGKDTTMARNKFPGSIQHMVKQKWMQRVMKNDNLDMHDFR